ncbi:MAG: hypothetical protein M1840_001288 [Geoglossum simile]|nr:MAG: hypothetical protein M1840_001288 [Geoglossum simile]
MKATKEHYPIANRCLEGFELFGRLCSLLNTDHSYSDQITLPAVKDELGRFRVWAGNIGAHRTGRISLDYRLRQAERMKRKVIDLLDDLIGAVQEAVAITSDERKPYDDTCFDSDSASSASDSMEVTKSTTEIQLLFRDLNEIITCLYKLSITIRNLVPRDLVLKATVVDVSHFETWDVKHVEERFPLANPALTERLGKANTKRRQIFKYLEKHHKKFSRNLDSLMPLETFSSTDAASPGRDGQMLSGEHDTATTAIATPSTNATTTNTQTTVVTFVEIGEEVFVDDRASESTFASSEGVDDESCLHVPSPPNGALDGEPFECPYCYEMMKVSGVISWRKHVLRDLQPYICTFENCTQPGQTFGTRHAWFDHEATTHRRDWTCSACQQRSSSISEFEQHMQQIHPELLVDHQLSSLADMCVRPMQNQATAKCPLCMKEGQELRIHLARHMRALSLFVLPRRVENNEEIASNEVQIWGSEDIESEAGRTALSISDQMSEVSAEAVKGIPDLAEDQSSLGHPKTLPGVTEPMSKDPVQGAIVGVDSKDGNGQTPLSRAAEAGQLGSVRSLITTAGVDLNSKDNGGRTPLSRAAGAGQLEVVRILAITTGVDLNSTDSRGQTPLSRAAELGHLEVVRLLATTTGVDINSKDSVFRRTPLLWAVIGGHLGVVKVLAAIPGVDIDAKDTYGRTTLWRAAAGGHLDIVKLLVATGRVNLDAKDRYGRTPLSWAGAGGHLEVVKLLANMPGVDVNTRDTENQQTPLSRAAATGKLGMAKLLLTIAGVDVNAKDDSGQTPLSRAAEAGHLSIVKLLLTTDGVDVDLRDNNGLTPKMWATNEGHLEVVELLESTPTDAP